MATHDQVAHAWANQTGRHRKGFNMYYEGRTIYSYGSHFPIASIADAPNGQSVVLFTTENYSVSTSKHKTITRRACGHLKVFYVPAVRDYARCRLADVHAYNVESYKARIKESFDKAKRAKVYTKYHLDQANALIGEAKDYIATFQLQSYEDYDWSPESITADLAAKAERERKAAEEAYERRRQAALKVWRENHWPIVKDWLRGGSSRINTFDYLTREVTVRPLPRVRGDMVETTWGASVPLDDAIKAYHMAVRCRRTKTEFNPGLRNIQVGDFALRRIKPNGDLVIGCHDIPFRFMQYAARRAGIPDEPAQVAA